MMVAASASSGESTAAPGPDVSASPGPDGGVGTPVPAAPVPGRGSVVAAPSGPCAFLMLLVVSVFMADLLGYMACQCVGVDEGAAVPVAPGPLLEAEPEGSGAAVPDPSPLSHAEVRQPS